VLFDATNASILVIWPGSVITRDGTSFVQVPTSLMSWAHMKYFVLTVQVSSLHWRYEMLTKQYSQCEHFLNSASLHSAATSD